MALFDFLSDNNIKTAIIILSITIFLILAFIKNKEGDSLLKGLGKIISFMAVRIAIGIRKIINSTASTIFLTIFKILIVVVIIGIIILIIWGLSSGNLGTIEEEGGFWKLTISAIKSGFDQLLSRLTKGGQ